MNSFSTMICINYYFEGNINNPNSELHGICFCLSYDNYVYSCGKSLFGTHGHCDHHIFPFKQIQGLHDIKMLCCGDNNTICLNYSGEVYSFGSNGYGELGIGKSYEELKFTHIPQKINLPPCKQVACGACFVMCLTEDNKLYSFGDNEDGQLGLGNNTSYNIPQLIPNFNNIEYIVCGGYHSICKNKENIFYSWGYNQSGQLGITHKDNCNKPIQCQNWPNNIKSFKCGSIHTILLTYDGYVYAFGSNEYGELGLTDKISEISFPTLIKDLPEIQRIECGYAISVCIDINNNLWAFGFNENGQLGLGDKEHKYKPQKHKYLKDIIDISSGGDNLFVKTLDNKIYAFGSNKSSQIGIKTIEKDQLTPIQVLKGKEDIWYSRIGNSRQKSARK